MTNQQKSVDQTLQSQVNTYLAHLDSLVKRGQQLDEALSADSANAENIAATRRWQEDCGQIVNQLSGGSKAHWLARAFSQAFLKRSPDGSAAQGATPAEIVRQMLAVLSQAATTLSQTNNEAIAAVTNEAPAPHRFDFVHNVEIRPVLERAYADGRTALDEGDFQLALVTYCGILEAIVTDALQHKGLTVLVASGAPAEKISEWSFETRLAVAEKAGLIRNGTARLPETARTYRDRMNEKGEAIPHEMISEREARRTGQVLHVIMRDLDPGR